MDRWTNGGNVTRPTFFPGGTRIGVPAVFIVVLAAVVTIMLSLPSAEPRVHARQRALQPASLRADRRRDVGNLRDPKSVEMKYERPAPNNPPDGANPNPNAWMFYDDRTMSHTHIPKTGGSSLYFEMSAEENKRRKGGSVASGAGAILDGQDCYAARRFPGVMSLVMFRSPRSHVHSMFNQCFFDTEEGGYGRSTVGTRFPRSSRTGGREDYAEWVRHFASLTPDRHGPGVDYNCYDPRDLQARHMSCVSAPNPAANHHLKGGRPPDLSTALSNMLDADWVGIQDFYHESLCVLRLRRSPTPRSLPHGCGCGEDPALAGHERVIHYDHSASPGHDDFPREVLDMVDGLTRRDAALFASVLGRWLDDVSVAEGHAGRSILCPERRKEAERLRKFYGRRGAEEAAKNARAGQVDIDMWIGALC